MIQAVSLTINEIHVAIFFGLVSVVGGALSWAVNAKVQRDIAENNQDTIARFEKDEREFVEHKAGIAEQILIVVNGRYARSELCKERQVACNDRLDSFRQILELHLTRLEESLTRQIEEIREKHP